MSRKESREGGSGLKLSWVLKIQTQRLASPVKDRQCPEGSSIPILLNGSTCNSKLFSDCFPVETLRLQGSNVIRIKRLLRLTLGALDELSITELLLYQLPPSGHLEFPDLQGSTLQNLRREFLTLGRYG